MEMSIKEIEVLIVSGKLRGELPKGFLAFVMELPDVPLEHIVRHLPARQIPSMRMVAPRLNAIIRKASSSLPKITLEGGVLVDITKEGVGGGHGTFKWQERGDDKWSVKKRSADMAPLSELLRHWQLDRAIFFRQCLSSTLVEMAKPWLWIRPREITFVGSLAGMDADSLKTFLCRMEPFVSELRFQHVYNARPVLNDSVLMAAGFLDVLMVRPTFERSGDVLKVVSLDIGDATVVAVCRVDQASTFIGLRECANVSEIGVRHWVEVCGYSKMRDGHV